MDREGSQTVVLEQESTPVLQLHASERENNLHTINHNDNNNANNVRWETNVIDNENMNKKKTKICCIFHPQEEDVEDEPGQHIHNHPSDDDSDSDDSSASSSSSDEDEKLNLDAQQRRQRRINRRHKKIIENKDLYKPNAYEIQPDYTKRQKDNQNN